MRPGQRELLLILSARARAHVARHAARLLITPSTPSCWHHQGDQKTLFMHACIERMDGGDWLPATQGGPQRALTMPACQPSTTTQRARRGSTAPSLPAASSSSLPPPPSLSHVSNRRTHRGLLGRRLLGGRLGGGLLRDGLGSHCCFVELWGGWGDRPGRVGRVEMRVVGALYMNVAIERACGIICRPSEREIEGATRARLSRKTPSASSQARQSPRASDPLCACCKTPASRNIVSSCPHSWALPGAEISGSASAPPRAPAGRARARGEPDAEASAQVEERARMSAMRCFAAAATACVCAAGCI